MSTELILDERIMAMLREATIARVATVTPRGRPHVAPYWFWSDGERIVFISADNQTVRNLRANPDIAVLVDLGEDFRDLRGAHIRGRASLYATRDGAPSPVQICLEAIDRIHADEHAGPEFARYDVWETRDAVYVEVIPESATWYDLGRAESGRTGLRTGMTDSG